MAGQGVTFIGAQLLAPSFDQFVEDAALFVRGGRIVYAGPSDKAPPSSFMEVVDISGCYVIPGLFDLHVHIDEQAISNQLQLFLRYGVTGVRDVGSCSEDTARLAEHIAAAERLGPMIFSFGELVDGPNPFWPDISIVPSSKAEIEAHVARIRNLGLRGVKFYFQLPPEQLREGIEACAARDILTAGHVGSAVRVSEALAMGITSIEHVSTLTRDLVAEEEFPRNPQFLGLFRLWRDVIRPDSGPAQRLMEAFEHCGAVWVPTLAVYEAIVYGDEPHVVANPHLGELQGPMVEQWRAMAYTKEWTPDDFAMAKEAFEVMKFFVRAFWEHGGRLGVGSDTPNPYVIPGLSLQREMALLSSSGVPLPDILRQTCLEPARYLGEEGEWGSLEAGKRADFIVLEEDPLGDIGAIESLRAVGVGGKLYAPKELMSRNSSDAVSTGNP